MCEEFETHQDRSGQLDVLMGQSIVLSEINAEVPLENDIPSHQNLLLQRYEERIKLLSQENKVSKFCMDAGSIHVVEIGQYFMTKDTEEQFFARACREYTLSKKWRIHHNQKDGFRETQELDPYWKSRPVICTVNMELKSESGLWEKVILNLGSEFLMDQINSWLIQTTTTQNVPADLPEEQASQSIVKVFAARSKAKAKPQRREPVDVPSIIPMNERKWIEIEPGESSFSTYEISKKVINLLRHSQTIQRENDGAVQFWRIKNYLRNQFPQVQYWSDDRWKACLAAGGGGAKRRYQYCTDVSGTTIYFRALQRHSGRNLIDLSFQDNVIISEWILPTYLPHRMCV